jgi:hypothetical protein
MQQQMFDQFQQTFMTMAQMFASLHKDQVGLIRRELDELHTLTRELQSLQKELAKRPAPAPDASNRKTAPGTASTPRAPAGNGTPEKRPEGTPPPAPAATAAASAKAPSLTGGPQLAGRSDQEVHAWLYDRIATIQKERQSRWQTILGYLRGK